MDKLKYASALIGVGVIVGVVVTWVLLSVMGAKLTEIKVGPARFSVPTPTLSAVVNDTPVLPAPSLCPDSISRSKVQEWSIGATDVKTVDKYVQFFNQHRSIGGSFVKGDRIPAGVLVATSFGAVGLSWNQFPVKPIVYYQSYGLFETTGEYIAPHEGACMTIIP